MQSPSTVPQRTPPPSTQSDIDLDAAIEQLRQKFNVPRVLVDRMLKQESGGNDNAVSPVGAKSRWQIMPSTAKGVLKPDGSPINPDDPLEAAYGGLKILSDNYKQFRASAPSERAAWMRAVAAYHAGTGTVQKDLERGGLGIPDVGDGLINTRDHVYNIFNGTKPEDFAVEQPQQSSSVPQRTPQTSVTLGEGAVDESQAVAPLKFHPDTSEPSNLLVRAAQRAQGAMLGGDKLPDTHPDLTGISVKAQFDKLPETNEAIDALMAKIGPQALSANQRYRAETGRNLGLTSQDISSLASQTPEGKYEVSVNPTQRLIRTINAYNRGGVSEAQAENQKMSDESDTYFHEQAKAANKESVGALKEGAASAVTGNAQYLYNISMLGRALYTKSLYGDDSPQYKALEKEDADNQKLLTAAQQGTQPKSTLGEIVGAVGELPQITAAGGNMPIAAYVRHLNEGQVNSGLQAMKAIPVQAMFHIVGGATENLPRWQQEVATRTAAGTLSASMAPEGQRVRAFATGALLPVPMSAGSGEESSVVEPKQYRHADFGIVTEAENQAGVQKGKIRVTDEQGSDHVIIKPSTARNQRAIPLREETSNAGQVQVQSEAGQASEARSAIGREAGSVPERGASDRLRHGQQAEEARQVSPIIPSGDATLDAARRAALDRGIEIVKTPEGYTLQRHSGEHIADVKTSSEAAAKLQDFTEAEALARMREAEAMPYSNKTKAGLKQKAIRAAAITTAQNRLAEIRARPALERAAKIESGRYSPTPRFDQFVEDQTGQRVDQADESTLAQLSQDYEQKYADAPAPSTVRELPPINGISTVPSRDTARAAMELSLGPPLRETVVHANSITDAVDSGDIESLNRLLDEAGITDADLAVAKGEQYAQQSTTVPARTPIGATTEQTTQIRESQTPETSSTVPRRDSETARTSIPDRTGIAQRIEESRRGESVVTGEGISGKDSVERGRQLLADGRDPQAAVDAFKATGAVSSDVMALVRARHEELARAANKAFDVGGIHDATFRAAEQARQDWWEQSVKPMQTEWHKTGMAQQGETAIDTGTFYGLYRAFKDATGKEMSPQQEAQARKIASGVADIETKVKATSDLIAAELDKAASLQDLHPDVQTAIKRFVTESQREARAQGRKQARKSLDDEAVVIKSNIAAEFAKLKTQSAAGQFRSQGGLGALDPDGVITKEIIKYAKNRVKAGVTDIAQLVDDVHATLRDFADVSKREVAEAITGIGVPKRERFQSGWINVKGELRQGMKAEDAAQAINDLRSRLSSGGKITPEDAKAIWQYAREKYIDRGMDFNDMRTAVATDLGTSPEQVMRAFSDQPTVKRLSDEMYKQMSERRNARAQAEAWVHTADAPAYQKFIGNLPSFFFGLKTFGHGTVGMITHAGKNIFIPSRWAEYWPNFVKQYGLAFDKGYHERMMQDLEANPNFITAKRAGLANDPSRTFDDYQKQSLAKLFGRAGLIGSRGFDSLKLLRQDLFDSAWNKMPDSLKTPEMAKLLAEEMNHSTGVTKTALPPIASTVFFAPKLEASRWAWVFSDNVKALKTFVEWNRSTPEQQYHAKMVASRSAQFLATYGALLAANQGLLIATGSKDRINMTDPSKGDWLRFKIAGRTIEPTGGLISMVDFLGKIGNAAIGTKDPRESRFEKGGSAAAQYLRGKLSPVASTAIDIGFQADYGGRPLPFSTDKSNKGKPRYGWPEYLLTQQTPIPVGEAAKDAYKTMQEQGAPHSYIRAILQGTGVGLFSGSTGVHVGEEHGNRSTVIPPRPKSSVPARP